MLAHGNLQKQAKLLCCHAASLAPILTGVHAGMHFTQGVPLFLLAPTEPQAARGAGGQDVLRPGGRDVQSRQEGAGVPVHQGAVHSALIVAAAAADGASCAAGCSTFTCAAA